jgi:hypothetical protein
LGAIFFSHKRYFFFHERYIFCKILIFLYHLRKQKIYLRRQKINLLLTKINFWKRRYSFQAENIYLKRMNLSSHKRYFCVAEEFFKIFFCHYILCCRRISEEFFLGASCRIFEFWDFGRIASRPKAQMTMSLKLKMILTLRPFKRAIICPILIIGTRVMLVKLYFSW